jgi:FAD:protein FMN transferase
MVGCRQSEAFGTTVLLKLTDDAGLERAQGAVAKELDAIDLACSRFRADSELSRVNARAGRATTISPLLADAIALSLRAGALSGGDVDPTVGRSLRFAGYDRDWSLMAATAPAGASRAGAPARAPWPPEPRPVTLRQRAGWRSVSLDRDARVVRIPLGVSLDLGATAKAWAADRAAGAASRAGGCGALVAIGGDVALACACPPGGWLVRVTDDHRAPLDAPGQTIRLSCGGLATSSVAVRRWRHAGAEMHHIIDPRTGLPACSPLRTVSVVAGTCAEANIAATAALVRGAGAPQWLAERRLPARLVTHRGEVVHVAGWPDEGQRDR